MGAGLALPSFPQHAVSVRYATEHRCGVVVRGPGLSDAITGTDPLRDNLPLQASTSAPFDRVPFIMHCPLQRLPPSLAFIPAPFTGTTYKNMADLCHGSYCVSLTVALSFVKHAMPCLLSD